MKPLRPSAMQKFMACPYKWGQEELCGVEQPPSDATDLGSEFHRELELWLGKRKPPSQITLAGRMAREAMKNLPMPIVNVEREVNFEYGGVQYQGHIDADWLEDVVIRYHDHKSTSSLGWAKDEDDLREDPQHIIYGYALLFAPGDRYVAEVHASWQYTETKAPHHQLLVQIRRRPQEVEHDMQALHETVGLLMWRILEHRERVQFSPRELHALADSLPKNFKHCSAYGWRAPDGTKHKGCYLIDHCHRGLDPRHRLKAIMTQQSLRDRLLKRKQELGTDKAPEPKADEALAQPPDEPEITPEEKHDEVMRNIPADTDIRTEEEKAPKRRTTRKDKSDGETKMPPTGVRTSVMIVNTILEALEPLDRQGKLAVLAAVKELM